MEIRYYGAAGAAAGCSAETISDSLHTLAELQDYLIQRHSGATAAGTPFAHIVQQCSFLLDGVLLSPEDSLTGGTRIDVLPPFAGG